MCRYCFVQLKYDIANIERGEGPKALADFIAGKRNGGTCWCDWNIPIHWGGVSDPFQPIEVQHRLSYEALKVFAETKYPFVVSTKGRLVADDEYLDLLKQCNCVVQVSLVSPKYDSLEKGAPSFAERIEIIRKVAPHVKRVIVRAQPYTTAVFNDILNQIPVYADAGVYGLTVEGMKYKHKIPGFIKVAGDYCYPAQLLRKHFDIIKETCHRHGLKFYSAENRLRKMGDSLCCCGIDGLEDFEPNTYNLNHYLYDREHFVPTPRMAEPGTSSCLGATCQNTYCISAFKNNGLKHFMEAMSKDKLHVSQLTGNK